MARPLILLGFAACAVACGYGYETQTTTITGAPMVTSGPGVGEAELSRTVGDLSDRMAAAVCTREVRCGRAGAEQCVVPVRERARGELAGWSCSPAATRARVEECLASFDSASCEQDLAAGGRHLCATNDACGRAAALESPGRALAELELGSR